VILVVVAEQEVRVDASGREISAEWTSGGEVARRDAHAVVAWVEAVEAVVASGVGHHRGDHDAQVVEKFDRRANHWRFADVEHAVVGVRAGTDVAPQTVAE
jgi:hypothetical protein